MTIHAFDAKGNLVCGLLFPSSSRLSSSLDMPTGDKVTTRLEHVDCPACRKSVEAAVAEQRFQAQQHVPGARDCSACAEQPVPCSCGGLRHSRGVDGVTYPRPLPLGAIIELWCDACGLTWAYPAADEPPPD